MIRVNHLIERIDFDNIKCDKRPNQRRYASAINKRLHRRHIKECSEADHITHLNLVDEWLDQPALRNIRAYIYYVSLFLQVITEV